MTKKYITTLLLGLSLMANAEVEPKFGFDINVNYKAMEKQGPWDDRNYMILKSDLKVIPKDDQHLANVPLFYKIEMRKRYPNMGKYYPRTTHQGFLMEFGGIAADGVWHKEGLGLHHHKGNIVAGLKYKDPKQSVSYQVILKAVADNETALATGVSGNEVTIECNPTNKNNCVAGSNQSGGQTMFYSSDAGATWTKSQTNPGSCCDPTIDWSSDGSIVYQGDLSIKGRSRVGVRWSRSLDQGHTWGSMNVITSGGSDKEFIHVDRSPSSPYLDNIYLTWHDSGVMQFARSTDMGLSFSTPLAFSNEPRGIGSDITTDAAGNVYYFYPATDGSGIRLLKSTDGGATFSSGVQVSALNGDFDFPVPAMETREVFIYVSSDKSVDNDTVFVAWTDEADDSVGGGTGSAANNHAEVRVAKSTNGGSSWTSCAIPHNTSDSLAAGNAIDRFHPWLKVDELGVVHIAYYDTRHSNNRTGVDFYYSRSVDDCASWDTEMRYSTQTSSNLSDGQEWGDYNGLSVVLDRMAMTWTDNRAGKVAMVGSGSVDGTPPSNNPPTASFTYNCTDLSCSFDGTNSSDSDGSIASYSWSFGATGSTANNTFASSATYSVTLSVTDNEGAIGSSTQSVTVNDGSTGNIVPTAAFTYNCTDLSCSFDGTDSSDSDGTIASYAWSFGASGSTVNNTFASAGTYSVTLTVTDNAGSDDSTTQSVTVNDPPAGNITLSGTRTSNGRSITINWSGATGTDVDVYVNSSLNGATPNNGSVTYRVQKNTTYTFEICETGSTSVCSNSITL